MTSAIEVLKPGVYKDRNKQTITVSAADLVELATSYDPALWEAPMVVGHPRTDDPAYGWLERLFVEDGVLKAQPKQVEPQFAQLVKEGRFKKVSLSYFLRNSQGNPKPGKLYPKHLGFLGAHPPAVVGLKPANLSAGDDSDGVIELSLPLYREQSVSDLEQRERSLLEREQAVARAEQAQFVNGLVAQGRVLSAQKLGLVEFMTSLDDTGVIELAAGDGEQPTKVKSRDWFKGFLIGLPKVVEFSEIASDDDDATVVEFSVPRGATVDPSRTALHQKALAYVQQHNVDYVTAFKAVGGR